jgi:hypothetical protein
VITTLVVLQTGQLNRHSPPPSSRGTKTLRCIRTSQVAHFGLGILVSAAVCMSMAILAGPARSQPFPRVLCRFPYHPIWSKIDIEFPASIPGCSHAAAVRNSASAGAFTGLSLSRPEHKMNAFLKRFLMHYGIYRRYPLARLPALRNAWRTAQP